MKRFSVLVCLIMLAGCSKSEVLTPLDDRSSPVSSIVVSHLCNDDLVLVDGLIQLKISKEEAIKRGVPASEYNLVEKTLIEHNERTINLLKKAGKSGVRTKSEMYGNTMAFGMLQDPPHYLFNYVNSIPLCVANEGSSGGIVLSCTFSSDSITDLDRHVLRCNNVGSGSGPSQIEEYGYTIKDYYFPGFMFGSMTLEYSYYGNSYYGICIYQIYDNS